MIAVQASHLVAVGLMLGICLAFATAIQLLAILAIVVGIVLISLETTRKNPYDLFQRELALGIVLPSGGAVAYRIDSISSDEQNTDRLADVPCNPNTQ